MIIYSQYASNMHANKQLVDSEYCSLIKSFMKILCYKNNPHRQISSPKFSRIPLLVEFLLFWYLVNS